MCVNTDHIVYETRSQNLMRRPSEQRKAAANKGGEMAKLLFTKGR
jgi:hypothetical protein